MENNKNDPKWKNTKEQLSQFSQKAIAIAKSSESKLKKLSHHGRIHFDTTALHLRLERLYYLIGKEFVKHRKMSEPSAGLSKLLKELDALEEEYQSLKSKIKPLKS